MTKQRNATFDFSPVLLLYSSHASKVSATMPPKKRAEIAPAILKKNAGKVKAIGVAELLENDAERQMKLYEQAIRTFREQKFEEARELFEQVTAGPRGPVAHTARLHLAICERRSRQPVLMLNSPEDHYNYAVERINAGELATAREHLMLAQNGTVAGDHVYYALAACDALSGDTESAYENLKRAIEIDPRNRISARQDADFASASQNPLWQHLLYPDRNTSF